MNTSKTKAIFQLKVSLRDIEPPVWRRLQIAEDTKLPRLHRTLQLLFNWEDNHLHDFVAGRRVYSVPDPRDSCP
ncbi:MAG: plasmid pRiA4b ORF-3 family protein [Acidobacteria bacterium]|nr:plasmid pRiA4b ORF-3 family protein [Acidobacteriota bacterium]